MTHAKTQGRKWAKRALAPNAINRARLNVWRRQPQAFFDGALIDMDGTLTVTTGECPGGSAAFAL